METKKRGRPPKHKTTETTGMTYDGAINYTLDKQVRVELDDTLAYKSEDELTEDERKYLKPRGRRNPTPSISASLNRKCRVLFLSVSSLGIRTRPSISVIVSRQELIC